MKRKFVAPLIALLLCVSMIGVGFAGWVITTSTDETASGNFTVYTVTDNRYSFTANTNAEVIFGYGSAPANSKGWLTYNTTTTQTTTAVLQEDLIPSFVLTSTVTLSAGDVITYEVGTIAVTEDETNKEWTNAVKKGFVAKESDISGTYTFTIPASGTEVTVGRTDSGSTSGVTAKYENNKLTVTFANASFAWGAITNGQNPYTFFNTYNANDPYVMPATTPPTDTSAYPSGSTYADVAKAMLQGIYALNNEGVSFSVTVTGSRNAAAN